MSIVLLLAAACSPSAVPSERSAARLVRTASSGDTSADTASDTADTALDTGRVDTGAPLGPGFMTGGGALGPEPDRVSHGFALSCDLPAEKAELTVTWGRGRQFVLDSLDTVLCSDDPAIEPGGPAAGFDTLTGTGTGTLDGTGGVAIELTFTDAGEPPFDDTATLRIDGGAALDVSGPISGNHQAHGLATQIPHTGDTGTGNTGNTGGTGNTGSTGDTGGAPLAPSSSFVASCSSAPGAPAGMLGAAIVGLLALRRRRVR